MKLKWNWGTKIVVAYAIFIVLILTAVFKAMNEKVDLVTPDYYAQEVGYQTKLDKMENAESLSIPVSAIQTADGVIITFPVEVKGPYTGTVLFYRPSNSADDITMPITTTANGQMVAPITKLKKGNYNLLVDWAAQGKTYFSKLSIFIQ
ncbi:MAG: FixH family protein [Sphingobacteriales bacterium JAD_PAG50586_3]|nr:MAG: FixH family protein [Sphingobacteriales bacterium JAD_PAG50586_3]